MKQAEPSSLSSACSSIVSAVASACSMPETARLFPIPELPNSWHPVHGLAFSVLRRPTGFQGCMVGLFMTRPQHGHINWSSVP